MSQSIYDHLISRCTNEQFENSRFIQLETVDLHTCGEPLRILVGGAPELASNTILGQRNEMLTSHDWVRQTLMYEPRGHTDMYGCLLVPPERKESDLGVIFMHNEGYSTMCGHAIIALTKLILELGKHELVRRNHKLKIDAPCGLVESEVLLGIDSEFTIEFRGVPSFAVATDQVLALPEEGPINFDIAFGGAFYAYVDSDQIGLDLVASNINKINYLGRLIKALIVDRGRRIEHPFEDDLSFLYGVIFYSKKVKRQSTYRNVCVFADGEIDRSPTGSGFCGMLALLHEKGTLGSGDPISIESIISSRFQGQIESEMHFGGYSAIIPKVAGNAYITGRHLFLIDPEDELKNGFLIK